MAVLWSYYMCGQVYSRITAHTLSLLFPQFSLSLKHTPHTVYLRTSPEVCYKRVQERGREEEKTVKLVRAIDAFSSWMVRTNTVLAFLHFCMYVFVCVCVCVCVCMYVCMYVISFSHGIRFCARSAFFQQLSCTRACIILPKSTHPFHPAHACCGDLSFWDLYTHNLCACLSACWDIYDMSHSIRTCCFILMTAAENISSTYRLRNKTILQHNIMF